MCVQEARKSIEQFILVPSFSVFSAFFPQKADPPKSGRFSAKTVGAHHILKTLNGWIILMLNWLWKIIQWEYSILTLSSFTLDSNTPGESVERPPKRLSARHSARGPHSDLTHDHRTHWPDPTLRPWTHHLLIHCPTLPLAFFYSTYKSRSKPIYLAFIE